jgi:thymidylate synthase
MSCSSFDCVETNNTHEESQYLQLIRKIVETGSKEESRNGVTYSIFGHSMRFSLRGGQMPLLTTKKVAWRTCFKELVWFLSGGTDNADLVEQGVHIWDGNSTREFLDSRGLHDRKEGDLGPIYGHQWRHFNAPYKTSLTDYSGQGIDQMANIIELLKTEEGRKSRRLVISAWNPQQLDEMALPPCHILMQFHVRENRYLSCSLYQRSGDVGLGVPFNIASYAFLTHILAHHCDLEADEFVYFLGNAHIYEEHLDILKEQMKRCPFSFPRISLKNRKENIEDYSITDIEWIEPYLSHSPLKMEIKA